jgi:hypothetical protein
MPGLAIFNPLKGHTFRKGLPGDRNCVSVYIEEGWGAGGRIELKVTPLFTNTTFVLLLFIKVAILGSMDL